MRQGEQGEVRGTGREYARINGSVDRKYARQTECREGRTGGEGQRNATGRKRGDERADREIQRDGSGETERRIEEYNVTEVGGQRDEQGATKERKGAEFLKGLHLRAGFGIMER